MEQQIEVVSIPVVKVKHPFLPGEWMWVNADEAANYEPFEDDSKKKAK